MSFIISMLGGFVGCILADIVIVVFGVLLKNKKGGD